jgi:hypothetical protein
MLFETPRENQGQIIEVAYACAGADYMIKRVHDRSDRTTSYYRATITESDWEWYETYEPCNGEPPLREWTEIDEATVRRMDGDAE